MFRRLRVWDTPTAGLGMGHMPVIADTIDPDLAAGQVPRALALAGVRACSRAFEEPPQIAMPQLSPALTSDYLVRRHHVTMQRELAPARLGGATRCLEFVFLSTRWGHVPAGGVLSAFFAPCGASLQLEMSMNAKPSIEPGVAAPRTDVPLTVAIGPQSWQDILPTLLALLTSGTAQGQSIAKRELQRMAAAADLSTAAWSALGEFASRGEQTLPAALLAAPATADQGPGAPGADHSSVGADHSSADHSTADLAGVGPSDNDLAAADDPSPGTRYGKLARAEGKLLPLEVCYSAAGFYLGTYCNEQPFSRESEYFPSRDTATRALQSGEWTQRDKS